MDRAPNQLKSPSSGAERSRGREGPAPLSGSNMAGRGGDVMCSWSGFGSATDLPSVAVSEEQKPRKRRRAFCLSRMKSRGKQQQPQPAANNNNMPFMMHCQLGKEIKHICRNCRGVEPLDGERTIDLIIYMEKTRFSLLPHRQTGRKWTCFYSSVFK